MTISVSASSVAFGPTIVQNVATRQVTVTSTAEESVSLTITGTSGPGSFTVSPASGTATASGLVVTVTFRASAVGDVRATLRVRGPNNSRTDVALTGEGIVANNPVSIGGSYLLVKVPDYGDTTFVNATEAAEDGIDPTRVDGNTLQSYLRLGAFDFGSESPAAKELLAMIPKAGPAKDPRSVESTSVLVAEDPGNGIEEISGCVFNDDVRVRPQDRGTALTVADDPDHGLTMAERQAESAKLYARGGWRDHSDGNRISTTWGDKVEVVRGNYKMIVLGRQNDPAKGIGWEASGGHIQDYAPGTMPGASFWLEWIDDARFHATGTGGDGRKGAWLLVNTTENVYEAARTAGNLRSEEWGDVHEAYVGSENPPPNNATFASVHDHGTGGHAVPDEIKLPGLNYLPITPPNEHDQQGKVRSNPHIIERTWARRIDSHTGSENWAIPKIVEKTFADDIEGHTGSSTKRVGSITDKTWAKDTDELVDVSNMMKSNTRAGAIFGATTAGTIWESTTTALHTELHAGGVHLSMEVGAAHVELEAAIGHLAVELALKGEIQIAGGFEISIGDVNEIRFGKKRIEFNRAQAALKRMNTVLSDSKIGMDVKVTTLKHTVTALSVALGV